jgi:hypothetical protein
MKPFFIYVTIDELFKAFKIPSGAFLNTFGFVYHSMILCH